MTTILYYIPKIQVLVFRTMLGELLTSYLKSLPANYINLLKLNCMLTISFKFWLENREGWEMSLDI